MARRTEIVLVRHGRPLGVSDAPIAGRELGAWVRGYDEAGINRDIPPPEPLRQLAARMGRILSSDLRRSIESASLLSNSVEIDPELREAGLPDRIQLPARLHPGVCVAIARVVWWLGQGNSTETIADTRARALRVEDRLCALAQEHQSVLVVGHGMFNRFIATCLRKRGWRGPRMLPHAYWSTARFVQNP